MNLRNDAPAVVVLSGGQDSATCLAIADDTHKEVHAISFDYGQRHRVELDCAADLCEIFDVTHKIVKVDQLKELVKSALLNGGDVNAQHDRLKSLPATFVPARNALFLTLAHAYAQEVGALSLYTGVCQTDYSGYPDCRAAFVTMLEQALNLGYDANIRIYTPMMFISKAETFKIASDLGVLDVIVRHSHTCYNGVHDEANFHPWGYGCGECPACKLRIRGWIDFTSGGV